MRDMVGQYRTLVILREELRRQVCTICIDRNADGTCNLDLQNECVVFESLPRLSLAISRVQSSDLEDYIRAIRENICDDCFHQNLAGSCKQRKEVRCSLDRHLLPIVQVVEEIHEVMLEA